MNALVAARATSRLHARRTLPIARALTGWARPAANANSQEGGGLLMILGGAAAAAAAVFASDVHENRRHALAVGAYSLPIGDAFPDTVSMGVPRLSVCCS